MTPHKWLTVEEVMDMARRYSPHSDMGRLIADWREMRELLLSCEDQLPACTRDREDIEDMREATGND